LSQQVAPPGPPSTNSMSLMANESTTAFFTYWLTTHPVSTGTTRSVTTDPTLIDPAKDPAEESTAHRAADPTVGPNDPERVNAWRSADIKRGDADGGIKEHWCLRQPDGWVLTVRDDGAASIVDEHGASPDDEVGWSPNRLNACAADTHPCECGPENCQPIRTRRATAQLTAAMRPFGTLEPALAGYDESHLELAVRSPPDFTAVRRIKRCRPPARLRNVQPQVGAIIRCVGSGLVRLSNRPKLSDCGWVPFD